jgi:hypothetical protein
VTAKEIATDHELRAIAEAGTGFIITPFNRRWHRATCPYVRGMNTGTQKWFAATTPELTDYLQQRIALYDTAKLIEACPTCATE